MFQYSEYYCCKPHYAFFVISEKLMFKVVLPSHVAYGAKVIITATSTLPSHPAHHVFSTTTVADNSIMHYTYNKKMAMNLRNVKFSVLPSILKGSWPNFPFSTELALMWIWGWALSFDVDTSSSQITPSKYASTSPAVDGSQEFRFVAMQTTNFFL